MMKHHVFQSCFLLVLFLSEAGALLQMLLYTWFQVLVQGPVPNTLGVCSKIHSSGLHFPIIGQIFLSLRFLTHKDEVLILQDCQEE